MQRDADILNLISRIEEKLLSRPGVRCIGFGGKVRGGLPTGEPSIRVHVLAKKPQTAIREEEIIPSTIEGVATDVVVYKESTPQALEPGNRIDVVTRIKGDTGLPDRTFHSEGTLGCIVQRNGGATEAGKYYILSNDHIFHEYRDKDNTVEVKMCCGYCEEVVARVVDDKAGPNYARLVDAALAILEPDVSFRARVNGTPITGTLDLSPEAAVNWSEELSTRFHNNELFVNKVGAATGHRRGYVSDIIAQTGLRLQKQLIVTPIGADEFSYKGDSGAIIYDDEGKVVGLLHGGADRGEHPDPPFVSFGSHIRYVLEAFDINIVTNAPAVIYTVGSYPRLTPANERLNPDLTADGAWASAVSLVLRHLPEVRALLDKSRKFAVAWHRNHAPIVIRVLGGLGNGDVSRVPREIKGASWETCINSLINATISKGSHELVKDLTRYRSVLVSLSGRSREEVLGLLIEARATQNHLSVSSSPHAF